MNRGVNDYRPARLDDLPLFAARTPEQGKQLGIQQVADAADRIDFEWKHRAYLAVVKCATFNREFICDTVWQYLEPPDRPPEWTKPKALGAVMLKAARDGFIRRTDRSRISENGARHRSPVPVWESLTQQAREDAA